MTQTQTMPLIVLSAGGTGGHVFPAEALAAELIRRGYRLALITDLRGQAFGGALGTLDLFRVRAGGIAGRGLVKRLRAVCELAIGTLEAFAILRRLQPAAVVGFGGYASVPAILAAIRSGHPVLLHEQNAVLGRANRLFAKHAHRIAISIAETKLLPTKDPSRIVHTGMPVRPAVADVRNRPYPALQADAPIHLLVTGGSQGASVFARVAPDALTRLPESLRSRIRIAQQCRAEDVAQVRKAYADAGIHAEIETFFTDIPERLAQAHLAIVRSGASTVAELTCVGRPAILVPYPHAVDDHQTANAQSLDNVGGGWLMPESAFTADSLAQRLKDLFTLPAALEKAAVCAKTAGRPDAAERLADLVDQLTASPMKEAA